MDTIDVALVTWPNHPARIEYFERCVRLLKKRLTASCHTLCWRCSSETEQDTKYPWFGDRLEKVCAAESIQLFWREGPAGLASNMNAALRCCEAELIFLVQDDFCLDDPLDLSPGAEFLLANRDVDLLRYSWPGMDRVRLVDHPDGWRRFDTQGPWPYGDDPHLRRRDFMDRWGWYLEGTQHGASEGDMVLRLTAGGANIAAADKIYFGHGGAVSAVIDEHREVQIPR